MASNQPINYSVDLSVHPSAWPGSDNTGFIVVHKVDVIFLNVNTNSNFNMLRTGTNEPVAYVVTQVAKHIARGLYRIISFNATEHSCVIVISTEKPREDLMWKGGFPWDRDDDPQPKISL